MCIRDRVTHVLKLLQEDGELLRLSKGVYTKALKEAGTDIVRSVADADTIKDEVCRKLAMKPAWFKDLSWQKTKNHIYFFTQDNASCSLSRSQVKVFKSVCLIDSQVINKKARDKDCLNEVELPRKDVANFVQDLAKKYHIYYQSNYMDCWADAVTRLAGNNVSTDDTQDLLVALKRAGKLSANEMSSLLVNYLREKKQRV